MRRFVQIHPEGVATSAVLIASGLVCLTGLATRHVLLRFADWCDRRLAAATNLGGDD